MYCSNCNQLLDPGVVFCRNCGTKVSGEYIPPQPQPVSNGVTSDVGVNFDFSNNVASQSSAKRYQYKVLSQKDKWFSGKFDPATLEQAINSYAQQGWRVIGCATADIAGFGTSRQEFVTLLEREI